MLNRIVLLLCLFALTIVSCSKKKDVGTRQEMPGVNVTTNVEYGRNTTWLGDSQLLRLDIYSPKNASAQNKYPLIVMVHGGGFWTGSKEGMADIGHALAGKGMIVASIEYRLGWSGSGSANCEGDTASLSEAIYRGMQDLNASLRFLTANADKYFIDKNWIFAGGNSAGAVVALSSAYLTDAYVSVRLSSAYDKLGSLFTADNNLTNTYTIKGICSMWGGIFEGDIITASNAIPTIFYHGSEDQVVPVNVGNYMQCPNYQMLYGSKFIYDKLTRFGVPAVAHIYEGEGHAPLEYTNSPAFVASTTYCFLQALQNKVPQSGLYKQMESNCK